jgi:hypothetical protein
MHTLEPINLKHLVEQLPFETLEELEQLIQQKLAFRAKEPTKKNPAKAILESGFVGCGEAESTLSVNYKVELSKIMDEKYVDN